jgi:hypothetical protein
MRQQSRMSRPLSNRSAVNMLIVLRRKALECKPSVMERELCATWKAIVCLSGCEKIRIVYIFVNSRENLAMIQVS